MLNIALNSSEDDYLFLEHHLHLSHRKEVCQQDRTRHMPRGMCDFCHLPALSQVRSHLTFQKFFGNLYMQVCRCSWYFLLPMSNLAYLLYLKADGKWLPLWDAAFWNQQFFLANREAVGNYLLLSTRQRSSCSKLLRFKCIEWIKATKKELLLVPLLHWHGLYCLPEGLYCVLWH